MTLNSSFCCSCYSGLLFIRGSEVGGSGILVAWEPGERDLGYPLLRSWLCESGLLFRSGRGFAFCFWQDGFFNVTSDSSCAWEQVNNNNNRHHPIVVETRRFTPWSAIAQRQTPILSWSYLVTLFLTAGSPKKCFGRHEIVQSATGAQRMWQKLSWVADKFPRRCRRDSCALMLWCSFAKTGIFMQPRYCCVHEFSARCLYAFIARWVHGDSAT